MDKPSDILKKYWQYNTFRPLQLEIIESILSHKDTVALMPTGGGKSVCYQLPALLKPGFCLVVSPLVALMKDQLLNLSKRNIPAATLHGGLTYFEQKTIVLNAAEGRYKLLYVSPERLETKLFLEYLFEFEISFIAVDEAHCISQWGYDFRPPYLRIANLRHKIPSVPILALTASATKLVLNDIVDKLALKAQTVYRQSYERSNLSYSAFRVDSKINKIIEILNNVSGSAIVYCSTRRMVKDVSQQLTALGISADFYHAGLVHNERSIKQETWLVNKTRVIVCTNAFGMGIDKADVRIVIHYNSPDSLENYYQEAGRAGRDGKKAFAVLLYNEKDLELLRAMPAKRFPIMQEIRLVYQALADFLQIPVGIGENMYYDFNMDEFLKNFKLDTALVISVLKVLQLEGFIELNENIFLPARARFASDREMLNDFEEAHPEMQPIIKCLLRNYDGIFDNSVSIFENRIAHLLNLPVENVNAQLLRLQAFGIIEYLPVKDTPQIYFLTNRASAQFLHIDHEKYLKRKQLYQGRVSSIIAYIENTKQCRSKSIAAYFDDNLVKQCLICDNCLQSKKDLISSNDYRQIESLILNALAKTSINVKLLLHQTRQVKKEKFWKVMEYMQNEKKILVDKSGNVQRLK